MQRYWVYRRDEFVGLVRTESREAAGRFFDMDPRDLKVTSEDELTFDEWVAADVQMRA